MSKKFLFKFYDAFYGGKLSSTKLFRFVIASNCVPLEGSTKLNPSPFKVCSKPPRHLKSP